MSAFTEKERYERRVSALAQERSTFTSHYQELSKFVSPRRGRFERSDRNKGDRRHQHIINSRATMALRTATAGMFNGTMSPSRPWLSLGTDDPGLREFGPTREWFYIVQERMLRIFNDVNLYTMVPLMIRELLLFGTGCMSHTDDPLAMARFYTHTVGAYSLAQDDRMEVDTVARETEMTVGQIVSKFSRSRSEINKDISQWVRDAYDRGNYDIWAPVTHLTQPNPEYEPGSKKPRKRRFESVYYEPGNNVYDAFLSRKGYDDFPFYCPRWDTTDGDVYGTDCPGMTGLGDVKQLQFEEKRKAQGIDRMVTPVMQGPPALGNVPFRNLPGYMNIFMSHGGQQKYEPAYNVNLPIQHLGLDIKEVEKRIDEAFYVDLFNAISAMEGVQPRNQLELMQRNQERLLALGPVLQRMYFDFLDNLVARTFNQMVRAELVPPPPQELIGRELRPRYISTLALAQQSATVGNIDRFLQFAGAVAGIGFESALDKVNADQMIDEYGTLIGVPPRMVLGDEGVSKVREARQQKEAAMQAAQAAPQLASAVKMATDAKLDEDSVGKRMLDGVPEEEG